jgi:hypothetical protein
MSTTNIIIVVTGLHKSDRNPLVEMRGLDPQSVRRAVRDGTADLQR